MAREGWEVAREYREEYERLTAATEQVAHAVADLLRAAGGVGDHTLAVSLREAAEPLQVLQAQLVAAAEKAYALGQRAARQAQHEALQRRVEEATPPPSPRPWPGAGEQENG